MKIKLIFFSTLIIFTTTTSLYAQKANSKDSVVYINLISVNSDTVLFVVNGVLMTDGDCVSGLVFGLQMKTEDGWANIINVNGMAQMDCGLPYQFFDKVERVIFLSSYWKSFWGASRSVPPLKNGTYRITVQDRDGVLHFSESISYEIK